MARPDPAAASLKLRPTLPKTRVGRPNKAPSIHAARARNSLSFVSAQRSAVLLVLGHHHPEMTLR